jgi:hypothetical protein
VDVGWEYGDEKDDQRHRGDASSLRYEKANRTEDLANAGNGHHELWIWDRRRDHPNQIGSHVIKVCGGCKTEHHR